MRTYSQRGFTLPEVIVTTVIVIILTSISIGFVYEIRKEGRDARRIADLEQLEVVLKLFRDQYRREPICNHGMRIEPGGAGVPAVNTDCADRALLLSFIEETMREIPVDPLGPNNPDYFYYYDSNHLCANAVNNTAANLLFAVNMEARPTNAFDVCGDHEGNNGGYMRTTPPSIGGSINPSQPYVIIVDYERAI